jgi:hypothetical protein
VARIAGREGKGGLSLSRERTVRQFVDEVNRLVGDDTLAIRYRFWERDGAVYSKWGAWVSFWPGNEERLMAPAEQEAFLRQLGLESLTEMLGLDAPMGFD